MKKLKLTFLTGVLLCCVLMQSSAFSQSLVNSYFVELSDKDGVTFDPLAYFDAKTISRRIMHNIPIDDKTDYPLRSDYVQQVENIVTTHTATSRWFNGIAVVASDEQIMLVRELPFVKSIIVLNAETTLCTVSNKEISSSQKELMQMQTRRMGGDLYKEADIDGKGVRVAIFDAGFPGVDVHPAFQHLRDGNRILKTWDFVKDRENVYDYNSHGASCLSCIAGMYEGEKIGLATGAEFLLARTEQSREPFSEEVNWLEAAEWADKNGADIISSSLGYTHHRYFREEMDGSSLVARAANMAARKGILVVNAMGNDGDKESWHYVGTPADADSVLSIAGIDPYSDYHINFSSYGPTASGVRKPNVAAYGHAFLAKKKGFGDAYGTSFATPLVSGFAACALQTNPSLSAMELFAEIEASGDLYPYYDYAHGYGVPQADYFLNLKEKASPSFTSTWLDDGLHIIALNNPRQYDYPNSNYMYYQLIDSEDNILEYKVVTVYREDVITIDPEKHENAAAITVFYNGFMNTISLKN